MRSLHNSKDMPMIPKKIVERAVKNADVVMENRRDDVKKALALVPLMREKSRNEGILALEDAIADIKASNASCVEFLSEQIIILVDATDMDMMIEMMVNEFLVRNSDDFEALILYIYMLALIMVRLELDYGRIRYRESAWKNLVELRNEYVRYLPEGCRKVFNI